MSEQLKQLSFFELEFLVTVSRLGSVRAAARSLGLSASHASKVMARVEARFGRPLMHRSASGVTLTREALGLVEAATAVMDAFSHHLLGQEDVHAAGKVAKVVTIGSLSHLNKHVVAPILEQLHAADSAYRFRLMDLAPDQIGAMANKGILDIALHTDKNVFAKLWSVTLVGKIDWGFFCRVSHPVLGRVSREALVQFPFVVPTYWQDGGFAIGNDFCPIPWSERIKGHEASNAETALQIVAWSDHIAFLPKSMVRRQVHGMQEIHMPSVARVSREVYLGVQRDNVSAKLQRAFSSAISAWLK